jgi:uncharacterized protein YdcH (DUF465 family)
MNRTDAILEDVTNHYNNLVHEHKQLHNEIEQCQYYAPDADLKNLKIKKLKLKDELERLKTNLTILAGNGKNYCHNISNF